MSNQIAGAGNHRDSGHATEMSTAAHRPEVDRRKASRKPSWSADGDSPPGRANGGRESHLGATHAPAASAAGEHPKLLTALKSTVR